MNHSVLSTCVALVNFRLFLDSQAHVFMHRIQVSNCIFLYGTKKPVKTINCFFLKINFEPGIIS